MCRSSAAQVSFLVSTALAILVAIGTFVVLALYRGQSVSVDVTSVIFTGFAFGWLILPIFVFGLDSTLDPAPIRMPVLLLCGAAYGFVLALASVRIAALAAECRLPELAQIAIRSKL